MALFAAVVWLAELLYQVGTGMAPDGSITEARATNRLNNGVVALMFVVVTTMVLGYGNVSSHITSCKAQRVPCSCVLYTDQMSYLMQTFTKETRGTPRWRAAIEA